MLKELLNRLEALIASYRRYLSEPFSNEVVAHRLADSISSLQFGISAILDDSVFNIATTDKCRKLMSYSPFRALATWQENRLSLTLPFDV